MGSTSRLRLGVAVISAVLGAALISGVGPPPGLRSSCPIGQAPDDQDRWQCVHECPAGTLYDGQSGVCVAPPGVPPPALPQTPQIPQIPQI
ncbi:MAG: hypothetical protein U0Q47_01185 [Mycobacterium sp.]